MRFVSVTLPVAVALAAFSAVADDAKLRLNFEEAPSVSLAPSASEITLDELLSVSPRGEGLNMSVGAGETAGGQGSEIGLGYSDSAQGVSYEVFTSFAGNGSDRFGLSGLNSGGLGRGISLNGDLSLNPGAPADTRQWQVGGRLGYAGFSLGADFAREYSQAEAAEYRDYRLGVTYAGQSWRVGMQYMRSLQASEENLLGVADALELGGVWNLNRSIDLIGGVQFWDQQELSATDNANRDALIFVGTRIQF